MLVAHLDASFHINFVVWKINKLFFNLIRLLSYNVKLYLSLKGNSLCEELLSVFIIWEVVLAIHDSSQWQVLGVRYLLEANKTIVKFQHNRLTRIVTKVSFKEGGLVFCIFAVFREISRKEVLDNIKNIDSKEHLELFHLNFNNLCAVVSRQLPF